MENKQINTNPTKLVRIDAHTHQYMKITAARQGTTLGRLVVDDYLERWGEDETNSKDRG